MRRRSTLLPIAVPALATASAGPTTVPTTGPASADAGRRLRDDLNRRYDELDRKYDRTGPNAIENYEQVTRAWDDLFRGLTTRQCDDLIAYATTAKPGDGDFDKRLATFVVTRAVQDGDADVLARLLANVWADEVDGCYTEWVLEKQTGRAVEILTAAYAATPSRDVADKLAAVFRRAFSQVDGDHLTDREYVAKCRRFWTERQPVGPLKVRRSGSLRLNDHYQKPSASVDNPSQARADRPAPAPDPDAGMLFRE